MRVEELNDQGCAHARVTRRRSPAGHDYAACSDCTLLFVPAFAARYIAELAEPPFETKETQ